MSSWDHGEALKLKVHGNDYARKVWLATAPPPGVGGRPREGDDIDVFKRFVVDAYERRRYYRDPTSSDGGDRGTDITGAAEDAKNVVSAKVRPSMPVSEPAINAAPVRTPSTVAPAPVVDLLDFGAFDTPAPAPATVINSSPRVASSSDAFFDPFNNNSAAMVNQSTTAATNNIVTSNSGANQANDIMSFDSFAPPSKGTAITTNASSMQSNNATSDPFGVAMATNASSMQSNNATSDPFSVLAATPNMPINNSWGMMPTNPNSMSNFNNSTMMNGGMSNFSSNNTMMMNGGGMMMNNGNAMVMMNGNFNAMNSNNAMMMNGGFNNMMNNGSAKTAMMNSMSNGGSMMPSNMVMSGGMQQQSFNRPPPQSTIMNSQSGPSMFNNNSISNNFSAGSVAGDAKTAAQTSASTKPDPFAGLMGL